MPRIRKKTSNRGTTHQRSKIKQKAAETRKKNRRSSKQDVTWKSNKKKDPGIPNSFPYKDQILAEVAESRRIQEEEKQKLRDEKKALQTAASKKGGLPSTEAEDEDDAPGINILSGSRVASTSAKSALDDDDEDDLMEGLGGDDEDIPVLFDADYPTLESVFEKADVLLEVVDARDPLAFRSEWLETAFVEGEGKVIIVLTKADLVPREALKSWLEYLRPRFPTCVFKSSFKHIDPSAKKSTNGSAEASSSSTIIGREALLAVLEQWSAEKKSKQAKKDGKKKVVDSEDSSDDVLTVAVAGLPNVGKSSLINCLLGPSLSSSAVPVAPFPPTSASRGPTTTSPISIDLSENITLIDTPGWIFADIFPEDDDEDEEEEEDEEEDDDDEEAEERKERNEAIWDLIESNRVLDTLRRNIGRIDRIKEPIPLAEHIILRASPEDLMVLYNTPAFISGDTTSFLTSVARSTGRLKKHGVPDLDSASRLVLRDWSLGQFPYYSLPPAGTTLEPLVPTNLESLKLFTDVDDSLLASCKGRKEMRSQGRGLVKLQCSEEDIREVVLDDEFMPEDRHGGDDDEEDEDEGAWEDEDEELEDSMEEGEDGEEEDDGEDDEEDAATSAEILKLLAEKQAAILKSQPKNKKRSRAETTAEEPAAKKVAFNPTPLPQTPAKGLTEEDIVSILKRPTPTSEKITKKEKVTKDAKVKAVVAPKAQKSTKVASSTSKKVTSTEDQPYDFNAHFF